MFLAVIQRGLGFKDHQVHVPVSFKISSLAASCYPHTTLNILLYFSAWCTAQFLQLDLWGTLIVIGGGGGGSYPGQIPVECAASILPRTRTLLYISDQK